MSVNIYWTTFHIACLGNLNCLYLVLVLCLGTCNMRFCWFLVRLRKHFITRQSGCKYLLQLIKALISIDLSKVCWFEKCLLCVSVLRLNEVCWLQKLPPSLHICLMISCIKYKLDPSIRELLVEWDNQRQTDPFVMLLFPRFRQQRIYQQYLSFKQALSNSIITGFLVDWIN